MLFEEVWEEAIDLLNQDPVLADHITKKDLQERDTHDDVYLGLITSIIGQQLSVKAARTITDRFLHLFDDKYPHPHLIIDMDHAILRSAGLSNQKQGYVKNVAQYFLAQKIMNTKWDAYSDDEIISNLTQIKGVGEWTVQMILIFVLERMDILPLNDLGIQQGIQRLYHLTSQKKALKSEMIQIAEKWRPYRSIACLYLWEETN